jgi:hypothetical protein
MSDLPSYQQVRRALLSIHERMLVWEIHCRYGEEFCSWLSSVISQARVSTKSTYVSTELLYDRQVSKLPTIRPCG